MHCAHQTPQFHDMMHRCLDLEQTCDGLRAHLAAATQCLKLAGVRGVPDRDSLPEEGSLSTTPSSSLVRGHMDDCNVLVVLASVCQPRAPKQEAALAAVKCQRDDALLRAARLRQHLQELMGPLALPDAATLGALGWRFLIVTVLP